jgi:N-acetylmuramic acid 6-phosphate etherase
MLVAEEAAILLEKSDRQVKLALLMQKTGLSAAAGQELLQKHRGQLRCRSASL